MKFRKTTIPKNGITTSTETSPRETKRSTSVNIAPESQGSPADGEVLREIIFHFDAMEPNDDLPGY